MADIRETITDGRTNHMPAHLERLGETKVRLLAAYVLQLVAARRGRHRPPGGGAAARHEARSSGSRRQPPGEWSPPRESVGRRAWTSFLAASAETMVFFAYFDPMQLGADELAPGWLSPASGGLRGRILFVLGVHPVRLRVDGLHAEIAAARMSITPAAAQTSLYAAHQKVYPREVSGRFARLRILAVVTLLGLFYGMPWVRWDGRQAVLFDLPARKFFIFGLTFFPQDFFLLTWLLIICALSLFFFTALAGRLWCGFACPQTVWTEIFVWMERFTEGNGRSA